MSQADITAMTPFVEETARAFCADLQSHWEACERGEPAPDQLVVNNAMNRCLGALASTEVWGKANQLPSQSFWKIAGNLVNVGSLQWHARAKPRGYAGDFEMLHKISTKFCCEHSLGRKFDKYFQHHAAPRAVRNRYALVGDQIVRQLRERGDHLLHVVSVGSGPAADVWHAIESLEEPERDRLRVTLMDIDPAALDFCRQRLASRLRAEQVVYRQENLHRVGRRPDSREVLESADMILCVGLFDYLDPPTAARMLETFWKSLPIGGKALVFNFSPDNPSRAYMEWLGNWYLLYRSVADLQEIAQSAGILEDALQINAEAEGVNLYLSVSKQ